IHVFHDTDLNTIWDQIEDWQNDQIMNKLFNYHLRKNINASINWKNLFINWQNQESNLIELTTKLKEIHPPNYTVKDRELCTWRALLQYIGYTNIIPFGKDSTVSNYLIIEARQYARINSPGANVVMSSYKTDSATGLSIYYLKNNKEALWERFYEEYLMVLKKQHFISIYELDKKGAVIVIDYKMKILLKSVRETKQNFFRKKGWLLHLVLIYTRFPNNNNLQARAFDYWSTNSRQDAWFTASSFHAAINELNPQPEWVSFLSDNRPHYYNADLMIIIKRWKEYRHVHLRFNITQRSDIELVIERIRKTSVAHLEPEHTKDNKISDKKQINTLPVNRTIFYCKIRKIEKKEIEKPDPQVFQYTTPKSPWFVPLSNKSGVTSHNLTVDQLQKPSEERK
ncbi:29980_t:CDS:10, partial [Racocetra persica]